MMHATGGVFGATLFALLLTAGVAFALNGCTEAVAKAPDPATAASEKPATAAEEEYGETELSLISRMTARLFSHSHYRNRQIDEALSGQLFDQYFNSLDPNHLYFTQEDVARFEPQRREIGARLLRGDSKFAFEVYELFRQRNGEFRAFAEERLREPFDFTGNETCIPDRRKLPRAADPEELRALWEKRLKNDILYYRLFDRVQQENASRDDDENSAAVRAAAKVWEGRSPQEKVLQRLRDVHNDIMQKDRVDILGIYLNALAQVYGPHSSYFPPKQDEDFDISMKLSLTGIGATLSSSDGYIKIVDLIPGGPAALDGRLKVEDRIIAVAQGADGEPVDVIDMPVAKAVKLIRGPENTQVRLTVLPGGKGRNAVPESIILTRAKVQLVESEAKGEVIEITLENGAVKKIGILTLPSFYMDFEGFFKGDPDAKSCSRDVRRILEKFNAEKVDAVVMDLRRNGGGSLPEAIMMTGLFIPEGPVVQIRSADRKVQVRSVTKGTSVYDGPLVVLISKMSASAAEIFAAAVRDCGRALLVGDSRTFGKGTVLDVVSLERFLRFIDKKFPTGSATYETAMFYRTTGGSVQQLGIASDIPLPSLSEELEIGEMFLDNHLPWDSIRPVPRPKYDPELAGKIAALKSRSEARVKANPEFAKLLRRIGIFRKYKDRKEISLNEETRWKEYLEEKEYQEESDRLYEEEAGIAQKEKDRKFDPALTEAAQIAGELADWKTPEPPSAPAEEPK